MFVVACSLNLQIGASVVPDDGRIVDFGTIARTLERQNDDRTGKASQARETKIQL